MTPHVTTKKSKEKMVKARAGDIVLPRIKYMVFGRGGVDEDGNVIEPSEEQTSLNDEICKREIEKHFYPSTTTCTYVCTIAKNDSEVDNEYISEIGLVDEEGDIVAIKNVTKKGKDSYIEFVLEIDDEF